MIRPVKRDGSVTQVAAVHSNPAGALSRGAIVTLILLLAINLLNYVDRSVLSAVEPDIRREILNEDDRATGGAGTQPAEGGSVRSPRAERHAKTHTGFLASAFYVSYMLTAPFFGWLADRMSRWTLVGIAVILWSAATGASGLASTYGALLVTRLFVGVGEAGYGPAAPTIIADSFPVRMRGSAMAWFYMAIPVGTALGYMISSGVAWFTPNWRWSFYAVVPPGLILGAWCFLKKDPPRGFGPEAVDIQRKASLRDYMIVFKIPSYLLDTAGMAAMTFAIGGISFYMPGYLASAHASITPARSNFIYGMILLVAGVTGTLTGGHIGDRIQRRWSGAYFIVSAAGIFLSVLFILLMLFSPFPIAWVWLFLGAFFLFFNTGPSNTILANVIHPSMRSAAFALNILLLHLFGDVLSQPLMGGLVDHFDSWRPAFYVVCVMMTIGGLLWVWGARYLARDTQMAPHCLKPSAADCV